MVERRENSELDCVNDSRPGPGRGGREIVGGTCWDVLVNAYRLVRAPRRVAAPPEQPAGLERTTSGTGPPRPRRPHNRRCGGVACYVQLDSVTCNNDAMRNRVAEHRARMKERGYKEVRYWVPDVTSAEFAQRISNEAAALNDADRRTDTAEFLDEIQAEALAEQ